MIYGYDMTFKHHFMLHWLKGHQDLFERMGRVVTLKLVYDRAGRSEGLAYVTYESPRDAQKAVDEFHGANANGIN
jgi:hypothetical protein